MKWVTRGETVKGPREYRASVGNGEYIITGPMLRTVPGTRSVDEFYLVNFDTQHVGNALTLKEAKVIAQRHYDAGCDVGRWTRGRT